MEVITYIPDTSTLVTRINAIKQWVYTGLIRIQIPLSVLEQVEERYRASIAPKEFVKEHQAKKSWSKAPREQHPLFDINPRVAWEFLSRARSEKGVAGVQFQKEEETFSQWEKTQNEVQEPESPPPRPTGYAGALLQKLNIQEAPETNGAKVPSKPRLVARSGENKTPWTYQKAPNISDKNVPAVLKPLLSSVLWSMYDYQNNPVEPEVFALLTDDIKTQGVANGLGIATKPTLELRNLILNFTKSSDQRLEYGLLEKEFPGRTVDKINGVEQVLAQIPTTNVGIEDLFVNGKAELGPADISDRVTSPFPVRNPFEIAPQISPARSPARDPSQLLQAFGLPSGSPGFGPALHAHPENKPIQAPIGTGRPKANRDGSTELLDRPSAATTSSLLDSLMEGSTTDLPEPQASGMSERPKSISPIGQPIESKDEESEVDSDEEIIVFKPRDRRASGRPKTPVGPPKSRPTTSNGPKAVADSLLPTRSPIFSTLKPQSPVFTPGQTYIPASSIVQDTSTPPIKPADGPKSAITPPALQSPARSPQPRSVTPRRPRAEQQQRQLSNDQLHNQSGMLLQRQREAIERRVKAIAKPAPRQVQMEPTENPTVIDPNAFDRTYVVQHPTPSSPAANGKQRPTGRGRRSPKDKEAKPSPRKPSERQAAEADVDFVLKSGQPRGSMRGKGKLWVP